MVRGTLRSSAGTPIESATLTGGNLPGASKGSRQIDVKMHPLPKFGGSISSRALLLVSARGVEGTWQVDAFD